MPTEQ